MEDGISKTGVRRTIKRKIQRCEKEFKDRMKTFDTAMEGGLLPVRNSSILIAGLAGVGKTNTLNLLLDIPPPEIRNSTPIGVEPVTTVRSSDSDDVASASNASTHSSTRTVRDIAIIQTDVTDVKKWRPIKRKDFDKNIAMIVANVGQKVSSQDKRERKQSQEALANLTLLNDGDHPELDPANYSKTIEQISTHLQSFLAKVRELLADEMSIDELRKLGNDWIYFNDSGGQPHFHNLLPHFVGGLSIILVVIRLTDKLGDHPDASIFEDGKSVGTPYKSPISTEDMLKCLVSSMQTCNTSDVKPKLAFIGTFYDQVDNPEEIISELDHKLCALFSEECSDQLVFSNDNLKELIFPINATSRGEHETDMAKKLRRAIESALPKKYTDIPIRWYILQVFLEHLAVYLGRNALSKQECLEVAREVQINDEKEFRQALLFFHDIRIFQYYPHILPDVVFISSQVLLDVLTKAVKEAYKLRGSCTGKNESTLGVGYGRQIDLRDKGIITYEFLDHLIKFEKYYDDDIIKTSDFITIFKKLLILAPILTDHKQNYAQKFFMPSLLDILSSTDLESYRKFSPIKPFVISFPNAVPRSGVFCCLQVYLIQELKWTFLTIEKKPKIVAQNCVMFKHPQLACAITLIDSFSYIEVYVETDSTNYSKILPQIQKSIFSGIKVAAFETLKYPANDQPQPTFFCPCKQISSSNSRSCNVNPIAVPITRRSDQEQSEQIQVQHCDEIQHHIGYLLEDNQIQCSVQQDLFFKLDKSYTTWFGSASGVLYETLLNVEDHLVPIWEAIIEVKHYWKNLGKTLGVSEFDLTTIQQASQHDPFDGQSTANLHGTLKKWIETGQATMNRLLEVLEGRIIGRKDLADRIRTFTPEEKYKIGLD